jgi:hypothetical protein
MWKESPARTYSDQVYFERSIIKGIQLFIIKKYENSHLGARGQLRVKSIELRDYGRFPVCNFFRMDD